MFDIHEGDCNGYLNNSSEKLILYMGCKIIYTDGLNNVVEARS